MSMSNLPPGCSVAMVPGNRPEDIAYEQFQEELLTLFEAHGLKGMEDNMVEIDGRDLYQVLWDKIDAAYNAGHRDGAAEERMLRQQEQEHAES